MARAVQATVGGRQYCASRLRLYRSDTYGPLNAENTIEVTVAMAQSNRFLPCLIAVLTGTMTESYSVAQSAPYPPSSVVSSVSWDFPNLIRLAPGSDLWPMTVGADGNVYTSWGDGGGFGGDNTNGRVSLGFGRISGTPPLIIPVNVWGGLNALNPATFGGKVAGLLSVGGVLYGLSNTQDASIPNIALVSSNNLGATWQTDWTVPGRPFAPSTFLNFGADYAGARDGYVYIYGGAWETRGPITLARAPKGQIRSWSAFEFFHGLDGQGNPTWTADVTQARPVFDDATSSDLNGAAHFGVAYSAALGRYLATASHGGVGQLGIFDAPAPWGPWTTVAYYSDWGSLGTGEALIYSLPASWMSADGKTIWCAFSSVGTLDSFNLVRATLTLTGTGDATAPSPPSNLSAR